MAVLDQATVFTEFDRVIPDEVRAVIKAHIVGPQAGLHRYSDPTEKEDIAVGAYESASPTTYDYPGKLDADNLIDLAYVAIFIDAAMLRYFQDLEGSGDTISPVASYANRIITNNANGWKTSGSFARNTALFDRDVAIGDVVHVKHSSDELWTTVKSLIATFAAASIASATTDSGNPATQILSHSMPQTSGTVNDVAAVEDVSLYNGLENGFINETYTVLVTTGSSGGNATTARLKVTSGSGTDNVASLTPAAFGSPTTIGANGAKVTWSHTSDNFVVGQTWVLAIHQAFTKPVPTSAGTYIGTQTQTYIIEVSDGGKYTDSSKPKITVTSNLGIDMSGPTDVSATATPVAVGTLGVTVAFTGTALRKGDKYYIVATAPVAQAYKTIQLADNLPAALQVAADMDLTLYIQKNLVVPAERLSNPPDLNWTADQSGVTLNDAVDAQDSTLTDGGVPFWVPVESGPATVVYIQYREWLADFCEKVSSLTDPLTVEAVLGPVVPDNPLAFGVHRALLNSNSQPVNFTAVCDPDDVSLWSGAFDILVGLDVSDIVALTFNEDVNAALKTHIDAQSDDEAAEWRRGWTTLQAVESLVVVDTTTSSDLQVVLATLADNPDVAGTQYTYLTVTTGNSQFSTNGVVAGDKVRYLFSVDAFGHSIYTEFTVASVVNEDTLILAAPGNGSAIGTPQKVEVWRNQTKAAMAAALAAKAVAVGDKRMLAVWPDQVDTAEGAGAAGYFLAAAFAGFVSGIAPHQGMETIPIQGFTGTPRSTEFFNNGNLNTLADGGMFVVTQSGSDVFVRDARTTDQSSAVTKWEVVVRNDDAIRNIIYNRVAQFFGISNLTQAALVMIRSELESGFFMLESKTFIDRLDRMALSHDILDIRISTTSPDTVIVQATVERPIPIGFLSLELFFTTPTSTE